jgi:hypothetical protein
MIAAECLCTFLCVSDCMQVGVAPNTITYNAALAALEKGGRWEQTIGLLQQVRLIATDCD